MQHPKYLNRKLEGSPFNLTFPEASSTPRTNVTYLNEGIFKKKLNREDFKALLIKERSFQVYTKRSALGLVAESYCVLVRNKNGIPAQFALVLLKGSKNKVGYTENGPEGKIVFASPTFNPLWDHLVNTVIGLPDNYTMSCTLVDPRISQAEIDARLSQTQANTTGATSTTTPQPAAQPAAQAKPATPTQKTN